MRELIPWWGRIGLKLVLTRVPAGYGLWRRLRVFRHGAMHDPAYALAVFQSHFARSGLSAGRPFVGLELGPGDSVASAVIAAAYGAAHTHLVDVGRFATEDLSTYRTLCRYLSEERMRPPDLGRVHDLDSLLAACHATYATRGLESLRAIPSASVDFVWSHAVLEHVRRRDFASFVRETRRVLRPTGICSHQVDLQDHLGGALNNLRIGSRWWEAEWMARSGFYTNRLRMSEMLSAFESAGLTVRSLSATRWDAMPTPPHALAPEFRDHDPADLLVKDFAVELSPAGAPAA